MISWCHVSYIVVSYSATKLVAQNTLEIIHLFNTASAHQLIRKSCNSASWKRIFSDIKKYSPRKWNITRGNKIFSAEMKCKNIPPDPKIFVAVKIYSPRQKSSPRPRNYSPRQNYSPRPRKYSPRKNIPRGPEIIPRGPENIPRGPENVPRGKHIPRGPENIPRGKKYSPRPRKYSPRKKNILFYVPPRLPYYIDGLVKERSNSIANALELRLTCTNPSICSNVI